MGKPGFSLIEFLISLTLFTIVIMSTAQVIIYSFLVKRQADINLHLTRLASFKLEYFKSLPYESLELGEGQGIDSLKEEDSQEIFHRKWEICEISSSLKMIKIEIFSKNNPQKKVRLALFLSKELGF